jgi:hypothetical protein
MNSLHNLKPERVIKAFERDGWEIARQKGWEMLMGVRSILLALCCFSYNPVY